MTPLAATFLVLTAVSVTAGRIGHGIASRRIHVHGIEGENLRPKPNTILLLGIGLGLVFLVAAGVSAAVARA